MAVLAGPVVLLKSAAAPVAVFRNPVVLLESAESPVTVFALPVVLLKSANAPVAVLESPVVLFKSAPAPVAAVYVGLLSNQIPLPDSRYQFAAWCDRAKKTELPGSLNCSCDAEEGGC